MTTVATKPSKVARKKTKVFTQVKTSANPLHVHKVVMLSIQSLNPASYNPRRITPQMLQSLKDNILANGFVEPIVVRKAGRQIIGGHQRVRAMRELCVEKELPFPEIPCVVVDVDDRAARQMNIALNKISGDFDDHLLEELLADMQQEALITPDEVSVMGFDAEAFADLLPHEQEPNPPPKNTKVEKGEGMSWLITCPSCRHEFKHVKR